MNVYVPPSRPPPPPDFDEFFTFLTPQERQLHELANQKLQSSYFVQWTHMYRKWKKTHVSVVSVMPVTPVTPVVPVTPVAPVSASNPITKSKI